MPDAGHFAMINYEKQVHDATWSAINAPIIFDVIIDQTKRKNTADIFHTTKKITRNVFRNGKHHRPFSDLMSSFLINHNMMMTIKNSIQVRRVMLCNVQTYST